MSNLPSRIGLTKPFFRQVPLSEYEQQISEMRDIQHISCTLQLNRILRVKTIKQYVALCSKILKRLEVKRKKATNLNEDLLDVCNEKHD